MIPLFKVSMSEEAIARCTEVLRSGFIGQGPVVDEFEQYLKSYFTNDYVTTCNSATSGLTLALHMLKKPSTHGQFTWQGIEPGDEVLTTPLTCTATNFPILANNLNIKWVDVNPNTLNIDLKDLQRKITRKTKVIMLVHWGGYPNDLDKINKILDEAEPIVGFRPKIIEDCAHAFGSKYKDNLIGTHGNISVFSLQAIKHVTSVDGGVVIFPTNEEYKRAKLLRWYGIDRESNRVDFRCEANIPEAGFKYHMNDVCAAIGLENLKASEPIIKTHKDNAAFYDKHLSNTDGITLLKREEGFESSSWIYSILVENKQDFHRYMIEKGIAVSQVHERNDKHTCLKEYRSMLPYLDSITPKLSAIPVGWWVTEKDREYIVDTIKKGW